MVEQPPLQTASVLAAGLLDTVSYSSIYYIYISIYYILCRNWRISTFNFYKLYQEAEPKLSIFSLTASIQTMFSIGKLTSYSKHAESKGRCKVFVGVNGIYTKCCDTSWNFVTTHDSDCHGKPLEWRSLQVLTKQWEADGMEMAI